MPLKKSFRFQLRSLKQLKQQFVYRTIVLSTISMMILTACASSPPRAPLSVLQAAWHEHKAKLSQIDSWDCNGRIVVYNEHEAWNANVNWQQRGKSYRLRFNTPSGQGIMRLEGQENWVEMFTAENEHLVAHDPETLIEKRLKLKIPVSLLYYWIRGIPSYVPAPKDYTLDDRGYLSYLDQAGWKVEYKRYTDMPTVMLPDKLFLEGSGYNVRVVISEWQFER